MSFLSYLARRFLSGGVPGSARASLVLTAAFGIFLASTFVLVGVGILAGFQAAYRDAVLGFNSHVVVSDPAGIDSNGQHDVIGALQKMSGEFPYAATPYLFYETLMPTKKGMQPVVLKGIDLARKSELYPFSFKDFEMQSAKTGVYVGAGIPQLQDIGIDKPLKLISIRDKGGTASTSFDRIGVTGTFASGLYQFDSQYIYMDLADLRRRYFTDTHVDGFEIRLTDPEQAQNLASRLKSELSPGYEITTWRELNASLFAALTLEKTAFFAIAVLVLAIGCLNVFGFTFLFFLQRRDDFLILSFLGMPIKRLRRLLNGLSLAVGFVATLAAVIVAMLVLWWLRDGSGIALDPNVYFVSRVPARLEWRGFVIFIIATGLISLATSAIAGRTVLRRHLEGASIGR